MGNYHGFTTNCEDVYGPLHAMQKLFVISLPERPARVGRKDVMHPAGLVSSHECRHSTFIRGDPGELQNISFAVAAGRSCFKMNGPLIR